MNSVREHASPLPSIARPRPKVRYWPRYREMVYGIAGIGIVLTAWQLSASLGLVRVKFTSSPFGAISALARIIAEGQLWDPLSATLASIGIGLGLAVILGIPAGLVIGRSKALFGLTEPLIGIMYSVPYVVFLPLVIFWFGIGDTARLVIVLWAAVFPLLINVIAGARNVGQELLRVAQVFCANKPKTFRSVLLPATMPYILAGLRQSVARALVGSVVAELFMGGTGLGYVVQLETTNFQMDRAMAMILVIAVLAVVLTRLVALIERKLTFWSTSI